jgi:hypothetical protein
MYKPWVAIGILALGIAGCSQPSAQSGPSLSACSAQSQAPSADKGAIAGQLGYPSEFIPPLTVYAIPVASIYASSTRASAACYGMTQVVVDQGKFRILGLPAGEYYVLVAWQPAVVVTAATPNVIYGDRFGGAYTQAVLCGLSVTCIDHSLIAVTVRVGQTTSGIEVADWYAELGTLPNLPSTLPSRATLPAEPAAFPTAVEAARYYAQLRTGGVYTQAACPLNRACVSIASQHQGEASAYFLATAGSNTDLLSCGIYVSSDSAGWHLSDVRCTPRPAFPAVGATGVVAGLMGDTQCVNVRLTPGRAGKVSGCVALGTGVEVDGGPAFVNDSNPSLGAQDRLWWHLKGRGWMVHTYLRNG